MSRRPRTSGRLAVLAAALGLVSTQAQGQTGPLSIGPLRHLGDAVAAGLAADSQPRSLAIRDVYTLALERTKVRGEEQPAQGPAPAPLEGLADRARAVDFDQVRSALLRPEDDGFTDPSAALLKLLARLDAAEVAASELAYSRLVFELMKQLVLGEVTSIDQSAIDRLSGRIERAGGDADRTLTAYRDALDAFRVQLGLAPDAEVVPDRGPIRAFHRSFDQIDGWLLEPAGDLEALARILERLPSPPARTVEDQLDPDRTLRDELKRATETLKGEARGAAIDPERLLDVRDRVRALHRLRGEYESARRELFLAVRNKHQIAEQLLAPPARGERPGDRRPGQWLLDDLAASEAMLAAEGRIVASWLEYQATRLELDRRLGRLPERSWEEFRGRLEASTEGPEEPDAEPPPAIAPAGTPPRPAPG